MKAFQIRISRYIDVEKTGLERDFNPIKSSIDMYRGGICFDYGDYIERKHTQGLRKVSVPEHLGANNYCIIGNMIFKAIEVANYDWNYYAKSYGHPKKTVTRRYVCVSKIDKFLHVKEVGMYIIDSFRTKDIMEGLAYILKVDMPHKDKLQTNKYYTVSRVKKGVYKQKFGKLTVGYIAVDEKSGMTYHDKSKEDTVKGLDNKIKAMRNQEVQDGRVKYTAKLLHTKYWFCMQGIKEFCDAAGLDINKEYSLAELKKAVKKVDRYTIAKYRMELEKVRII